MGVKPKRNRIFALKCHNGIFKTQIKGCLSGVTSSLFYYDNNAKTTHQKTITPKSRQK